MSPRSFVALRARIQAVCILASCLFLASPASANNWTLENPSDQGYATGITVLSGWACEAKMVEVLLTGSERTERIQVPYGGAREDTAAPCNNDGNNGFAATTNLNRLGNGEATATLYINGKAVKTNKFRVTRPTDKLRDPSLQGQFRLTPNFPDASEQIDVVWTNSTQNFAIASSSAPIVPSGRGCSTAKTKCSFENPQPSQFASGIFPITGWACSAKNVHVTLKNASGDVERVDLPYGADRADTVHACNNDGNNGFGAVTNLNRLGTGQVTATLMIDNEPAAAHTFWVTSPTDQNRYTGAVPDHTLQGFPSPTQETTLVWQESAQNFSIENVSPPDQNYYSCTPVGETSFAQCINDAESNGCFQPECTVYLGPTTATDVFYLDTHVKLPKNMKITGDTGSTDCATDPDNCELNTWIIASNAVNNGCGPNTDSPGDPNTRIGFVLNDKTWLGNFNFKSLDTGRWQGYDGASLCGGGVFETPGCADAYCTSPKGTDITNREGSADGIYGAVVDSVYITGEGPDSSNPKTAPQLAAFVLRTRDLTKPSHDLYFHNITLAKSWADGINLHGSTRDVSVEHCNLSYQGDDNLAVWSVPGPNRMRNITFYDNTLSQVRSTNPNQPWGNCIAIYGGGGAGPQRIWIDRNKCERRPDGYPAAVKFSTEFADASDSVGGKQQMFGYNSEIYVLNRGGPDLCSGAVEDRPQAFPYKARINGCPDISGWPDCPDPAFIREGCQNASWDENGPWGPAWYCNSGEPKWGNLATACIHKGCEDARQDPDTGLWVCSNPELIYDSCRIKNGCSCSQAPCESIQYDHANWRWSCKFDPPNWNGLYDACDVPRGACQNGLIYSPDEVWTCYNG
ncbi:MAG: hypothetical protein P8R42_13970 [Candidatus Binatia bacterium]|nr:hypothetical protein [Candidatus Binatia bacterium]